jgi:hypothetical protein
MLNSRVFLLSSKQSTETLPLSITACSREQDLHTSKTETKIIITLSIACRILDACFLELYTAHI